MEPPLSSDFHHTRWATVAASAFYPNILDLRENEEVIRNLDIYFPSFIKGLQHDFYHINKDGAPARHAHSVLGPRFLLKRTSKSRQRSINPAYGYKSRRRT